jgi:O-antigen ligase
MNPKLPQPQSTLLNSPIHLNSFYLKILIYVLFLGYAVFGKGFAYFHLPLNVPIFIGEIFLILGIITLEKYVYEDKLSSLTPLLPFLIWGMVILLISVWQYGLEALRDSAMVYYSLFAIIVFNIARRFPVDSLILSLFSKLLPLLITWYAVYKILTILLGVKSIIVPGTKDIRLFWLKPGDLGVLLLLAFVFIQLFKKEIEIISKYFYFLILIILAVLFIVSVGNRGAFLAFSAGFLTYLLFQPFPKKLKSIVIILIIISLIISFNFEYGKGKRKISSVQLKTNIDSIINPGKGPSNLVGTTNWRLLFWRKLFTATANNFDRLLFGFGFGENLATTFEMGKEKARPNKHPHNFTINIFARMGIFGLLAWVHLNIFCVTGLLSVYKKSSGIKRKTALWLLTIWVAAITNSMFDVYLEGPMGAIPFWIFMGFGYSLIYQVSQRENINIQSAP